MVKTINCVVCNKEIIRTGQKQKYCKECALLQQRKRGKAFYYRNREKMLNSSKQWKDNNKERVTEYNQQYSRSYRLTIKEKKSAHQYAYSHNQKDNKCLNCDEIENLEFHHTSYEKREGITLCKQCHTKVHKKSQSLTNNEIKKIYKGD